MGNTEKSIECHVDDYHCRYQKDGGNKHIAAFSDTGADEHDRYDNIQRIRKVP